MPVERFTGKLDLVFGPDFVLPPTRARTLVTIHDVTFLINPEWFEAAFRRYINSCMPRSLQRADLVLVDSEATRTDLVRLTHVPKERVAVVYLGAALDVFRPLPASVTEPVRQKFNLPQDFLLFVSTLEPRKNLVRLLEAMSYLDSSLHLVVAGKKGWLFDEIFATVQRLGLTERIHFLGPVYEELPALYNLARAFVYPSLYEGFGMPVIEAMACGTPVVTANNSSLPEVAGNAAVLVNALDSRSIADGVRQALAASEHLRAAGPVQAQKFTWHNAAQSLLECFERAMKS
ncbi:MAG: glycosyltransferase family 4 protein [Chloroflexaceae bacterium]|nr:glycosyltransferase family 4 protein [Chloroflexaceae bacterium]